MADSVIDLAAELAELDETIRYVRNNGQTRTIRGKSVTYAPLSELRKERSILAARLNGRRSATTLIRRRRG